MNMMGTTSRPWRITIPPASITARWRGLPPFPSMHWGWRSISIPFIILILLTIRMAAKMYLLQMLPPMQTEPLPSPTKLTKTIYAISYLKSMVSPGAVTGTPARIISTSRRWWSNPQSNEGMRSIPSLYGCRQISLKKDNR